MNAYSEDLRKKIIEALPPALSHIWLSNSLCVSPTALCIALFIKIERVLRDAFHRYTRSVRASDEAFGPCSQRTGSILMHTAVCHNFTG